MNQSRSIEQRSEVRTTSQRPGAKLFNLETDMDDGMLMFAKEIVRSKYDSNYSNQEIAYKLKEAFEQKYYPTWICIVGKSFGCKIEAQPKHYLRFQLENKVIILYKFK